MRLGLQGGRVRGKTTAAKFLRDRLVGRSLILHQDRYYLDRKGDFDHDGGSVNFDHPSSVDFQLMAAQLKALEEGAPVQAPCYDFATHSRLSRTDYLTPQPFIIVDGTLILSQPVIRECLHHCFYVSAPEELRFERRLSRDVRERGRSSGGVKKQILSQVKPMHDEFVKPSKKYADTIIENTEDLPTLSESIQQVILQHHWLG